MNLQHKLVNWKNIHATHPLLDSKTSLVSGLLTDVVVTSKEKGGGGVDIFEVPFSTKAAACM